MLIEILLQIHEAEIEASQQYDDQEFEKESNILKKLNETAEKPFTKKKETRLPKKNGSFAKTGKTKKKPDGSLYIESIKADKTLDSTDSCLEFLLVSFCKHFSLRPKQAAGLLTQGGKYLAYVIAKGLKGKHGPIILWYQEIYGFISHLLKLISLEEANGSVPLMLASLKSGFNSKSLETVL